MGCRLTTHAAEGYAHKTVHYATRNIASNCTMEATFKGGATAPTNIGHTAWELDVSSLTTLTFNAEGAAKKFAHSQGTNTLQERAGQAIAKKPHPKRFPQSASVWDKTGLGGDL